MLHGPPSITRDGDTDSVKGCVRAEAVPVLGNGPAEVCHRRAPACAGCGVPTANGGGFEPFLVRAFPREKLYPCSQQSELPGAET